MSEGVQKWQDKEYTTERDLSFFIYFSSNNVNHCWALDVDKNEAPMYIVSFKDFEHECADISQAEQTQLVPINRRNHTGVGKRCP